MQRELLKWGVLLLCCLTPLCYPIAQTTTATEVTSTQQSSSNDRPSLVQQRRLSNYKLSKFDRRRSRAKRNAHLRRSVNQFHALNRKRSRKLKRVKAFKRYNYPNWGSPRK